MLYPLKFKPRLVEKIWGGRKLQDILGKDLPAGKSIGESWELYDFPPGIIDGEPGWVSSVVANGPFAGRTLHELVMEFDRDLLGDAQPIGPRKQFPLLIKFLDAREDLSVQVHPPRQYAQKHPEAHLKTEAWYVLQADPRSRIYKGLMPGVDRAAFERAIASGQVEQSLQSIEVAQGHFHFLPSGTVHALGAGILAAEVQTPSDTTFRVYDFNRIDAATGKPRNLHVEQAMECIDFVSQSPPPISPRKSGAEEIVHLVDSDFFAMKRKRLTSGFQPLPKSDQPVVLMILDGQARIQTTDHPQPVTMQKGETILLPAKLDRLTVTVPSTCQWLEVTIPPGRQH